MPNPYRTKNPTDKQMADMDRFNDHSGIRLFQDKTIKTLKAYDLQHNGPEAEENDSNAAMLKKNIIGSYRDAGLVSDDAGRSARKVKKYYLDFTSDTGCETTLIGDYVYAGVYWYDYIMATWVAGPDPRTGKEYPRYFGPVDPNNPGNTVYMGVCITDNNYYGYPEIYYEWMIGYLIDGVGAFAVISLMNPDRIPVPIVAPNMLQWNEGIKSICPTIKMTRMLASY